MFIETCCKGTSTRQRECTRFALRVSRVKSVRAGTTTTDEMERCCSSRSSKSSLSNSLPLQIIRLIGNHNGGLLKRS